MGAARKSLVAASLDLKDLRLQRAMCENDYGVLWGKVLAAKAKKKPQKKRRSAVRERLISRSKRSSTRVLMKRRARLEGCRRRNSGMERRVRTLKRLIPKGESVGLEGLFTETADYIMSLEMRVSLMQIMVDALTASSNDDQN